MSVRLVSNAETKYAIKIIKAEERHIENAKFEVEVLKKIHSYAHAGRSKIVEMVESFANGFNFCIVFE